MKHLICLMLSFAYLLLFFSSCKKDEPISELPFQQEIKTYPNVQTLLWDYFERFEEEAKARGLTIDLNAQGITGIIQEINQEHVAGTCSFSSNAPNHVVIDLEFWNQASDLFKEMIIFHELGHCSLLRGHREDTHADGTCASIMRSGVEDCRDNYQLITRDAYLDELFEGMN